MRRRLLKTLSMLSVVCLALSGLVSCSSSGSGESFDKASLKAASGPTARKAGLTGGSGAVADHAHQATGSSEVRLVSLQLDPPRPVTGETLRAVVNVEGTPSDDDALVIRWTINGTDLDPTGPVLEHSLNYGDSVTARAELTSGDGKRQVLSTSVLVGNAPPNLGLSRGTVEQGEYVAVLSAEDPEEDGVALKLVEAPEGMVLDPETKTLRWRPAESQKRGAFPVVIEGEDSAGNVSRYSFEVTVSPPQKDVASLDGGRQ